MKVLPVKKEECAEWFLQKHYAKRLPPVSFAFGLYFKDVLSGVCSFGKPMSHTLVKGAFKGMYQDCLSELNRLVVNDGLPENTLSFFVSQCLKQLTKPHVVVSYADTSQNHHGYIYQATNWIYTGLSAKRPDYKIKGLEHLHSATVADRAGRNDRAGAERRDKSAKKIDFLRHLYGDDLYLEERPRKHRYFYLLGTKTEKKVMMNNLSYEIFPYPKGENKRYDSSYKPSIQGLLFN